MERWDGRPEPLGISHMAHSDVAGVYKESNEVLWTNNMVPRPNNSPGFKSTVLGILQSTEYGAMSSDSPEMVDQAELPIPNGRNFSR